MNRYGRQAMEHWRKWAPSRLAALPDPETFFTALGLEAETQVSDLAAILAGTDEPRENYLQKVARLSAARRRAEEVVMTQLAWVSDPELPLDQAREEFEQTTASWENLISWAERMQDSPDLMPSSADLEAKAAAWALTAEFLLDLVAAPAPRDFMDAHRAMLDEAMTLRFLRELS
ncbi:MAG: hypothetical protein CMH34_11710 [Microbacterium sp.]|nr:hypothetical protein [Microbacterium sp.]